jgi:glycine/D-amino acid oxidase-like deaminating enzyme
VWLATAHQMIGLTAALGTARLLGDLMEGKPPGVDPEPFRADRYGHAWGTVGLKIRYVGASARRLTSRRR